MINNSTVVVVVIIITIIIAIIKIKSYKTKLRSGMKIAERLKMGWWGGGGGGCPGQNKSY